MLNFLRHIKHGVNRRISKRLAIWASSRVYRATSGVVLAGPFKGLKMVNKNIFGSEIPKLLGCYEKEVNASLLGLLQKQPTSVCNIGAAEGYYAVGCARYASVKEVLVFESLEAGRKLVKDNLQINQIEADIMINGTCDEQTLWDTLSSNSIDLMLIDIEGAELDILSSRNTKLLHKTSLLIESHDFCRPDCILKLKKLFESTHHLTIDSSRERLIEDFPDTISMPNHLKLELMDEKRPGIMHWLIAVPKASN